MIPGEYRIKDGGIEINEGRRSVKLLVSNRGDRPVQVGSHFHFFEANRELFFERQLAFGMRLDIPAGTAVRFEPGQEKEVLLVEIGGARKVHGFNNLASGPIDDEFVRESAHEAAREKGFGGA